jgi:hypothetical protein
MFIISDAIVDTPTPPVTRKPGVGSLGGQPLRAVFSEVARVADLGVRAMGASEAADAKTVREVVPTS